MNESRGLKDRHKGGSHANEGSASGTQRVPDPKTRLIGLDWSNLFVLCGLRHPLGARRGSANRICSILLHQCSTSTCVLQAGPSDLARARGEGQAFGMAIDRAVFVSNFAAGIEGLDAAQLSPQTRFRELEVWDSLAVLSTLAMLDSDYGITLAAIELKPCQTLEDIAALVDLKKG
jgi:acyl carrier protein